MKSHAFTFALFSLLTFSHPVLLFSGEQKSVWPDAPSFQWHWLDPAVGIASGTWGPGGSVPAVGIASGTWGPGGSVPAAGKTLEAGYRALAGARMWIKDELYPAWDMEGEEAFYPGPPVAGIALKQDKAGKTVGLSVETGMVLGGLDSHYEAQNLSLNFSDWTGQELYFFPSSKFEGKWTLRVYYGKFRSDIIFTREDHARALAGVITSLASSAGYQAPPAPGLETADLTSAQAKEMGKKLPAGVLVLSTALGGPADKAGILPLDVIAGVNGIKVKNNSHFVSLLRKFARAEKMELSLLRKGTGGLWESRAVRLPGISFGSSPAPSGGKLP